MRLYEAHLPVTDVERSVKFYQGVLGWRLGSRDEERNIVFLLSAEPETMLGLWGPGSAYGDLKKSHVAFWVELEELFELHTSIERQGIPVRGFHGERGEPSVIGWMPTAQFYFDDPDGHVVEFIARVPGTAKPDFVGTYSDWMAMQKE